MQIEDLTPEELQKGSEFMKAVFDAAKAGLPTTSCPSCGATVYIVKSGHDGHIWASCTVCTLEIMQ